MLADIISQTKQLRLLLFSLYALPLLFLGAVAVVSAEMGVSVALFTRDPTATAGLHPFTGVVSSVGVLLWAASATICLFSWTLLRPRPGALRFATFLLCAGCLATLLLLDDLFLFHEAVFPGYFGVPEKMVFAGYGVLTLSGLVLFRRCILDTEYALLLTAFCFLGLSLLIDSFQNPIESLVGHWRALLEDGFKLLGIVGWFGYFSRCGFVALRDRTPSRDQAGAHAEVRSETPQ